ncbi:hypothetical protein RHMOL_Rhmol11G0068700 [Rhododendron molle]|uniref:Uncharacterized protein n=1 Tax=Rhododendron molle TaxID=49168 RepID=A0ACC0LP42_RHOML|nr:hypothetical protein RHMOL_Rhmol11G0068700 [Rhododendron molle]
MLVEGEVCKETNSFCRVSSINAASDVILQPLLQVLSERLHLAVCNPTQSDSTSTNRWHRGRSTTPRNQQRENFVINYPLLIRLGINKNGWDNKRPSHSYFGYSYNHRRLLK